MDLSLIWLILSGSTFILGVQSQSPLPLDASGSLPRPSDVEPVGTPDLGSAHGSGDQGTVCDGVCECFSQDGRSLVVDCSRRNLVEVPSGIPSTASQLLFRTNQLSSIPRGAFRSLTELTELQIEENRLSQIEKGAFMNLYSLQTLALQSNQITSLTPEMFEHLLSLNRINLQKNDVSSIHPRTFMLQMKSIIELAGIDMECSCKTKELVDRAREYSQQIRGIFCTNFDSDIENAPWDKLQCTEMEATTCWQCDASNLESCLKTGRIEKCASPHDVCVSTFIVGDSRRDPKVVMSCTARDDCLETEYANTRSCSTEGDARECVFCCARDECNRVVDPDGYTFKAVFDLQVTIIGTEIFEAEIEDILREAFPEDTSVELNDIGSVVEEVEPRAKRATSGSRLYITITAKFTIGDRVISANEDFYRLVIKVLRDSSYRDFVDFDTIKLIPRNHNELCPESVVTTEKGVYMWPRTEGNTTATIPCLIPRPNTMRSLAIRKCVIRPSGLVVWQHSNLSNCADMTESSQLLSELANQEIDSETIDEVSEMLMAVSKNAWNFTETDLELCVEVLSHLITPADDTTMNTVLSLNNIVETIDSLLDVNLDVLERSESETATTSRILVEMDKLSERMIEDGTDTEIIVKRKIAIALQNMDAVDTDKPVSCSYKKTENKTIDLESIQVTNGIPEQSDDITAAMFIPPETLQAANQAQTLQFSVFASWNFFKAIQISEERQSDQKRLASSVIAASFSNTPIHGLQAPVEITLTHYFKNGTPECVFWDFNVGWNGTGCRVDERRSNSESTICLCDHLTNFALLMNIYGQDFTDDHKEALMWISYIGCGLSLLGVLATLITYLNFKHLRRDKPSIILINLCFALLFLLISFILSTLKIIRDIDVACKVMAVILHYFIMATWAWIAVEAFYMYKALISVMPKYYEHLILKITLFGWGTPLIPIAVVIGISRDYYGLQTDICWLERIPFYAGCLGPIALLLIINIVIFTLVIKQLHNFSKRKNIEKTVYSSVQVRLRGGISVMTLLGLTWIFAIFAVSGISALVFNYLFTVFNALQGFFIFIFNCLYKKDVRKAWLKRFTDDAANSSSAKTTSTKKTSAVSLKSPKASNVSPPTKDATEGDMNHIYLEILPDKNGSTATPRGDSVAHG